MEKIPTAEEFLKNKLSEIHEEEIFEDLLQKMFTVDISEALIEFAKLHVELALEEASEKADMLGQTQHNNNAPDKYTGFVYVTNPNGADYGYTVNKDSILKSYPLENIK